jgi:hypothetical protein
MKFQMLPRKDRSKEVFLCQTFSLFFFGWYLMKIIVEKNSKDCFKNVENAMITLERH